MSDELEPGVDLDHLIVADANIAVFGFLLEYVGRLDLDASGNGVFLDLEPGALRVILAELNLVDLDFVVADGLRLFDHVLDLHGGKLSKDLLAFCIRYSVKRNNVRDALVRVTAAKALTDCGLTTPEVPIESVVATHGLSIQEGSVPNGWGYFHPPSWSIRLSPTLFQESPLNRNRRRFTLAHELGHCLLEHGESSCWNLVATAEPSELGELDDVPDFEKEAHLFARELLLPRAWLEKDWAASPNPDELSRRYGVSRETLFIVLMERLLLMQSRKRR